MSQEWIELKTGKEVFSRADEGWEIEHRLEPHGFWCGWDGKWWDKGYQFRGRPPQPKRRTVKSLCWRNRVNGSLIWKDDKIDEKWWERFPAGDITGEVGE